MRISRKLFTSLIALLLYTASVAAQQSGFNLVVVGDPQPQTEEQITRLERDIIPQIATIVDEYKATGYPTAILLTGDVVWDNMDFLPRVKADFEALGVPVYAVIGNHDHNKHHKNNQPRAEQDYINAWGERNQAFMLGETLFVTLDNIDYATKESYSLKVDSDQLIWLAEVMDEYADVEHVAVCMHAPATSHRTGGFIPYAKPIVRIIGERKIDFITGHGHRHFTADHTPEIIEHSVAQVNGNLWFAPICSDGTPLGVFCVEERDGEWMWHHRILSKSANEPLVIYPTGRVSEHEEYVVVKVVGWDDKWQLSWSENGSYMGAMEQISILDPDYMYYVENEADYREKYMKRLRRSARPHKHYFRCKPTTENSEITITATDRFGRVYTTTL
ncbi:MAG: calcineurin-like phosphoesterase C-terminal domain-containing protein [Alistipes sp.]|nr:calcineurin-like phosphoesterase C-terminal domain-containing protein [Alistipes sp.]